MLSPDGALQVDRTVLSAKAEDLDATIKRLRMMRQGLRQGLRHAAACPADHPAQCPTFQRLLKAAAAGRLKHGAASATVRKGQAKRLPSR
jgi:hypothetical protein